jgi:hypothetical protein
MQHCPQAPYPSDLDRLSLSSPLYELPIHNYFFILLLQLSRNCPETDDGESAFYQGQGIRSPC